jgi:16S rRNA (cytosine967-C5)-methyltransferase
VSDVSQPPSIDAPGLIARRLAAEVLGAVLHGRRPLDQMLDPDTGVADLKLLEDRDRALVHMLAAKTLRRLGTLRAVLGSMLERGFPKEAPRVEIALLLGATQILFLSVPDHAAVDLSVQLVTEDRTARRYTALVNAVLRRMAREGRDRIAAMDISLDTPEWLMKRWAEAYGEPTAREIVAMHTIEPSLDLSAKENTGEWAEKLGGTLLPTGSIRLASSGSVAALPGYDEGAWWVQDAAASLPAKLLRDVAGLSVGDLCAAPGGKTAQLLAAGAKVVAIDRSAPRLKRLKSNLERLHLVCETIEADASQWRGAAFDAVLVDAPCTSTGTIRRNPDLPWHRNPNDLTKLTALQTRLLDHAVDLVRPSGLLVYATCSLEPEECEQQIEALLLRRSNLKRVPVDSAEVGEIDSFISPAGDLRTLPHHLPNQDPRLSGCDGFYAARLQRLS